MTKFTLWSLSLLSVAALAGAAGQKTTQAALRDARDRVAAPSLSLADPAGKPVRLSDYRGKPVLLNLWATECGGCREELPTFVDLSRAYKDRGLTVMGVSMDIGYEDLKNADEGWARVKPFIAAHGMTYQIVLDDGSAAKAFNVTALPATYLVDRSGRIAATYLGVVDPVNLEANLKSLLAER